jgi:hypothetical protein
MRKLSRVGPSLALSLLLALSLAGCIHEDQSVALNSDGSGNYSLALGISDQLLALGSAQITASMDQAGAQFTQQGGTYSKHDDGSYTVWTFKRPFKSIADLNALLQQPLDTGTSGTPVPTTSSNSFNVSESSGFFTNTFHVTGHMSLAVDTGQLPDTGGVDVAQLLKDMRESFAISMPGWISAHNGGSVSGNTITYTVHYGEQASIDVSGGALTTAGIASIGAGIVLLLVVIAGGALLVLRRRAARSQPAVAPAAVAVPYSPLAMPNDLGSADDTPTLASSLPAAVDEPPSQAVPPDVPTEQD